MYQTREDEIKAAYRKATLAGLGLFLAMSSVMLAFTSLVASLPDNGMEYSVTNARVPCALSLWFALGGAVVIAVTRTSIRRRIRSIERGTAPAGLLRLGTVGHAKRMTVVIWGECAIGGVMAFAHWVSGRLTGVANPFDVAVLFLLSVAGVAMFTPRYSTWAEWFGLTGQAEEDVPRIRSMQPLEAEIEREHAAVLEGARTRSVQDLEEGAADSLSLEKERAA